MIYEVHQLGVLDADTMKPAWYQVEAHDAMKAAENYVDWHAKTACRCRVREWVRQTNCGEFDVEYEPAAKAEKVDEHAETEVRDL